MVHGLILFCVVEKLQGEQGVIQELFLSWHRNLCCPLTVVRIGSFKRKLKFLLSCMLNPLLSVSHRDLQGPLLKKKVPGTKETVLGITFPLQC